jgi:hypothetical protein
MDLCEMARRVTILRPELSAPLKLMEEGGAIAQKIATYPKTQVIPSETRALWRMLHERGIEKEGSDDSEWIRYFSGLIPCGDCRKHWREILSETPPDFNKYFAWTVSAHNSVNNTLGKPFFPIDQAYLLYQK